MVVGLNHLEMQLPEAVVKNVCHILKLVMVSQLEKGMLNT